MHELVVFLFNSLRKIVGCSHFFANIKIQFPMETYSNMYLLNRSKFINTFDLYVS